MTYKGKTLEEIQAAMDERFRAGNAYAHGVPWDTDRMHRLWSATVRLALEPRPRMDETRPLGLTLDVGCGEGGIAAFWPTRDIVGVELSPVAVERARKNHPDVEYHVGAAETFADPRGRQFDTIAAVETIEHWTDVPAGLRGIRRLLKDDGVFVLTTPNADSLHCRMIRALGRTPPFCSSDHVHEFGFDELRYVLEQAGFVVTRSLGVGLSPYWAIDECGGRIRELTDRDRDMIALLGPAGEHLPHLAFCQAHACRKAA
jgi:SAM-dependent methyltransferase